MAKSPVEVWLWLLLVMQPFNKKTHYILEQCGGDAAEACRSIRDGKYDFLSDVERKNAESVRTKDVRELLNDCAENAVSVITLDSDEYPPLLRGIENPPIVLFAAGSLAGLDDCVTLSAVGARNISDYGRAVAHRIIEPLAKLGIVITSGMAVGADAEAHRACLAAGGRTVGVLGCGILVNYPAENAELKRSIIKNGGAIISELLPRSRTFGEYFHIRNRIIAGLSLGTLVIEAGYKSGSLLSANHALRQGRAVFCVPPYDLFSMRCNGVIELLRNGATPVYGFTDILDKFSIYFQNEKYLKDRIAELEKTLHEYKAPKKSRKRTSKTEEAEKNVGEASEENSAPKLTEELLSSLEPRERSVLKLLANAPLRIDDIIEKLGADYTEVAELLTDLELEGYLIRGQDGVYTIT